MIFDAKKCLTDKRITWIIRNMSKYKQEEIVQFAEMFKALSNPHRLKIFLHLVGCCPPGNPADLPMSGEAQGCSCVGDLGRDLGIVPSTVSHHIKELRRAGLIRVERRGRTVECSMEPEAGKALRAFFT